VLLPSELQETSGVAPASRAGFLWTHDDGDSDLFALDGDGRIARRFAVRGGTEDLEDMAAAPCQGGGACLYLADTGDNEERRAPGAALILRVREPVLDSAGELGPERFPVRLPEGPRDIEAIFVLPGERIHLVTKGRAHAITVYRYPGLLRPDTVMLQEVQRLSEGPRPLFDQVTGASAARDGSLVAIRTYRALQFYGIDSDSLAPLPNGLVNLAPLQEIQGEGVAIGADGFVTLTSEGGPLGGPASLVTLRCGALPRSG
jgi:hypothetical protein